MNQIQDGALAVYVSAQCKAAELKRAMREERGAIMAEYGLLLALIGLALIAVLVAFRGELASLFNDASETLDTEGTNNQSTPYTSTNP